VLLDQYGFAHRWLLFLFGYKIITTRFQAWQPFTLFMPELFYHQTLFNPRSALPGQALLSPHGCEKWGFGQNFPALSSFMFT
jgi:hypothetical protein